MKEACDEKSVRQRKVENQSVCDELYDGEKGAERVNRQSGEKG